MSLNPEGFGFLRYFALPVAGRLLLFRAFAVQIALFI
jgi:hypothetical protein